MVIVYIALGSNLDYPKLQLQRAVKDIGLETGITITGYSKLYMSEPIGPVDQPDYYNAVVRIQTILKPLVLLNTLQTIENNHGRVKIVRWGCRTLDLDIILYGNQIFKSKRLTIPHYQMHIRNFVLAPLHDINPELSLPDGRKINTLLRSLGMGGIHVMAEVYPWL